MWEDWGLVEFLKWVGDILVMENLWKDVLSDGSVGWLWVGMGWKGLCEKVDEIEFGWTWIVIRG